jgi:hypothetical protein
VTNLASASEHAEDKAGWHEETYRGIDSGASMIKPITAKHEGERENRRLERLEASLAEEKKSRCRRNTILEQDGWFD